MPDPSSEIDVGTVLGGTYQIDGLLGRGGMGAVWSASHLRLRGKKVAVKVLLGGNIGDEIYARFQREADIASRIGHPNIVEVHDWNTLPNGTPYLVMELLQGESLAKRISRGAMSTDSALAITRQIGSALNAAHRAGVVHRDLKPDNIFLCPTDSGGVVADHVKVLDFGISKIKNSSTVQTQEARILGTPQYMAPEQASGKNQQIDQRTDVFALGAIVYEMLSGHPAFQGDNLAMVVFKVVFEEPTPIAEMVPGLPPNVVAAVHRALAKDPAQRYPDVLSFVSELTGRPLHTLDKISAQSPAQALAFDRTVDSQQQFASTAASGQVPATVAGLAKGTQPSGATPLAQPVGATGVAAQTDAPVPPTAPTKKKRTGLWIALGVVVVGGGIAGAVVATQGKGGNNGQEVVPGPAVASGAQSAAKAATSSAPVVVTPSSAAASSAVPSSAVPSSAVPSSTAPSSAVPSSAAPSSAAASSAPVVASTSSTAPATSATSSGTPATTAASSSAPAVVTTSSAPAAAATSSAAPTVAATSSAKSTKPPVGPTASKAEPTDSNAPEEVKEAKALLEQGDYQKAIRAAQHSMYVRKTEEAYEIQAIAYCGLHDLSNVNANLQNLSARRRARVHARCKQLGFELP